jgi:hypothetical protein
MTQTEFDDKVLAAVSGHINVMEIAADLRRQGDPHAKRIEEEQIFCNNVITSLEGYDVDSELMADDDIEYLFELATGAVQKFP